MINRPQRKFEKSLMIAGGISYHGLTKLIILDGTLNEFSYGQGLLFYKDDINTKNPSIKMVFILNRMEHLHTDTNQILIY